MIMTATTLRWWKIAAASFTAATLTTLLVACGDGSKTPSTPTPTAKPVTKAAPVVADPTANMSRAVTVGKSTAPVELKYDISSFPLVGQPVDIDLAIIPSLPADSIAIAFAGSTGLTVSSESAPATDVVKSGQISHAKVSVKADKEDVFYLNATVTVYSAGTTSPKTFAIPIIMSAAQPVAAPTPPPAAPAPKKK